MALTGSVWEMRETTSDGSSIRHEDIVSRLPDCQLKILNKFCLTIFFHHISYER
jgi:hypothetical protein